jgi:hypothetical protein
MATAVHPIVRGGDCLRPRLSSTNTVIGNDRDAMRRFFVSAWLKHCNRELLSPLENMVATVVGQHPEYHAILTDEQTALEAEFAEGAPNPFLHMGMHIAIQEQIGADRPPGIRRFHHQTAQRFGDAHGAEHRMMDCLGVVLQEAQSAGTAPDESRYLECLKRLAQA